MTMIDRDEALRRVHAYYDNLDALQGGNDPDRDTEARDAAFDAYKLVREIGAPLVAERLGAAHLSRHYYRAGAPWGAEARKFAAVVAATKDMDQDEAAAQRWMLARYLMDVAGSDLDPQLARNFVGALHALNLGDLPSLMSPYRVKGLQRGVPKATINFFSAMLVYYLAGYRGCSLDKVLLDETDTFNGMGRDTLNSIVARGLNKNTICSTSCSTNTGLNRSQGCWGYTFMMPTCHRAGARPVSGVGTRGFRLQARMAT
jgi:hypothetical protein